MVRSTLSAAFVCCLSLSSYALAAVPSGAGGACATWVGRYGGEIPRSESAFDRAQRVTVIVQPSSAYVAITDGAGGAFDASGTNLHCTSSRAIGLLDTGAGGTGKISASLSRRGAAVSLRLYGYREGDGLKNKTEYLPSEKLEIALKRAR